MYICVDIKTTLSVLSLTDNETNKKKSITISRPKKETHN